MPTPQEMSDQIDDLTCRADAVDEKLASMNRIVYRLPEADGMSVRNWLEPPDSVAHDNVSNIFNGPIDSETNFPSHPNTPTETLTEDWVWGGPSNQTEGWGYFELLQPTWMRDNNQNTGERGEFWFGECCGTPRLLQETTVNTPADDRGILDPVLFPAGIHYGYIPMSDFSANGGFQLQQSATETGTYTNFSGRSWKKKPSVLCMAVPVCDPVPEGWSEEPPKLCDPVFVPTASGGLTEDEVLALIPDPVPDQEICLGDFTRASSRTGWLFPRTDQFTANSGTITDEWVQVGNSQTTASNCATDIKVDVQFGNTFWRLEDAWGRQWTNARLLINGGVVVTQAFHDYDYEDDRDGFQQDIKGPKVALFSRLNVPAASVVTVELQRRYNFIVQPGGRGDVISMLRANWNMVDVPTQIVTGRV